MTKIHVKSFAQFTNEAKQDNPAALFLDLDHTVIKPKTNSTFPKDKDDWTFIPGVLNKIKLFQEAGYKIIGASNQGSIAAGYISLKDIIEKFANITNAAKKEGVNFEKIYFSKTNNKNDQMRKPNPGIALKSASELGINIKDSIMVGDRDSDKEFAANAGMKKFHWIKDFKKIIINEL
jgi:D-glycero-D-manno-heptose 1,7-bisphosphate phosphatase